MPYRRLLITALVLTSASAIPVAAQTNAVAPTRPASSAGIDDFHSPAVFGVFEILARKTKADTSSLNLLVLWRGSPGWLDNAALNEGLPLTSFANRKNVRLHLGSHDFDYGHDLTAGTLHFMGISYELKGANVVLIDSVDAPAGHQKITLLTIDPRLPVGLSMGPGIDTMIVHTPALLKFLDCGRSANTALLRKVRAEGVCGLPGKH